MNNRFDLGYNLIDDLLQCQQLDYKYISESLRRRRLEVQAADREQQRIHGVPWQGLTLRWELPTTNRHTQNREHNVVCRLNDNQITPCILEVNSCQIGVSFFFKVWSYVSVRHFAKRKLFVMIHLIGLLCLEFCC